MTGAKVAVVGGAGFLGSHLVHHLVKDYGAEVLVIDSLLRGRREWLPAGVKFAHADIRMHRQQLYELLQGWTHVFNYAACPYVPDGVVCPTFTCDVNFTGAVNVIEAAYEAGCRQILQVSSAELYGSSTHGKLNEESPVAPRSTYGVSKAAVDAYVQVRWREAKVPCIALRQFNCIGERETHPYVVPEIVRQITDQLHASHVTVRLGNNTYRDFMYAGDAVAIAARLMETGEFGQVYNSGAEETIQVYDLARRMGRLLYKGVSVEHDESRDRPWDIQYLCSDNAKVFAATGIRPTTPLDVALMRTIAWFRKNGSKWPWE